MRILSLAIIATLCLGMMPCAQTADPNDSSDTASLEPGEPAQLASRPATKLLIARDAPQQKSNNRKTASLVRAKRKTVLQVDALSVQNDPVDTAAVQTADGWSDSVVNQAGNELAAIQLAGGESPLTSKVRLAENLGSVAPNPKLPRHTLRPIRSRANASPFQPLAALPIMPKEAAKLRHGEKHSTNTASVVNVPTERVSQSVSAADVKAPAETQVNNIVACNVSKLPPIVATTRSPTLSYSISPSPQSQVHRRAKRSSNTSSQIGIAGKSPIQFEPAVHDTLLRRLNAPLALPIEPLHSTNQAPIRVPDAMRPVAPRAVTIPPSPLGTAPIAVSSVGAVSTYRTSTNSFPTNIGGIESIGAVPNKPTESSDASTAQAAAIRTAPVETRIAATSAAVAVPATSVSASNTPSVQPVAHHADELSSGPRPVHVAELSVGTIPRSTRRIKQAGGQLEAVDEDQGGFSIPFQTAPTIDGATLKKEGELVVLVATDVELRSVLRLIAEHHKLNLVIGPNVKGAVTVSIRGAQLEEVLNAILGVAGFQWHREGNLLYVTGSENPTVDPKVQGRRLQVYPLNYVSSKDLEPIVNGLLSPIGKAYVNAADQLDQLKTRELLIVEDNESGHTRVAQYLAQIDIPPSQVLVEAHVLQIDLSDQERHGVNLRGLARLHGSHVSLHGTGFAEEATESPCSAFRVAGSDVGHLIKCICANTNSRTLASPKVSVVNRQTAKVQIGQRLPYAVATTTQTSIIQDVRFLDVGIVLEVTPVITNDGNILMTVLPKVSGGKITESGFPEEDTTQVETTVLMPDGSGLVIGGLIREVDTQTDAMVPGLGRIPVVKYLFKKRAAENRRNELVVALVTHIMHDATPVRQKECIDLNAALPDYAASELRGETQIRYADE